MPGGPGHVRSCPSHGSAHRHKTGAEATARLCDPGGAGGSPGPARAKPSGRPLCPGPNGVRRRQDTAALRSAVLAHLPLRDAAPPYRRAPSSCRALRRAEEALPPGRAWLLVGQEPELALTLLQLAFEPAV